MSDLQAHNVKKAEQAQIDYCKLRGIPFFAPLGGYCCYCHNNIYMASRYRAGISLVQASMTYITSCPHCNKTFLD